MTISSCSSVRGSVCAAEDEEGAGGAGSSASKKAEMRLAPVTGSRGSWSEPGIMGSGS